MHPYRSAAPIASSAVSLPFAHGLRRAEMDLIDPLLLAVGGVVALAGMLFADGTELALGALMIMVAVRRATTVP